MELRRYTKLLRSKWWLTAITVVVTVGMTVVYLSAQPTVYESSATYVVRAQDSGNQDTAIRATDALAGSVEIGATFAAIARSDQVERVAKSSLASEFTGASVSSDADIQPGTSILRITARGPTPEAARAYAAAVAAATLRSVNDMNPVFGLEPLDSPKLPSSPETGGRNITLGLSVILGVGLALGLSYALEYMSEASRRFEPLDIIDPKIGVKNEKFFEMRLREELSRCRSGAVFSVAMLRIQSGQENASVGLRRVASIIGTTLAPEDVLCHVGDKSLAVIMPEVDEEGSEEIRAGWQAALWPASGGLTDTSAVFDVSIDFIHHHAASADRERTDDVSDSSEPASDVPRIFSRPA